MKPPKEEEYDFSKAKRGRVLPLQKGKTRITIRLDNDLLAWFRKQVHAAGGGNYQPLMNDALRLHVQGKHPSLEQTLRRVIRAELATHAKKR
jgi:uncharacterized protein (DUF4415 family)